MRYALILAAVLLSAPLTASANQTEHEYCLGLAKEAQAVAAMRDDGLEFTALMDSIGEHEYIRIMARWLYIKNPRTSPEAAARGMYQACMEGLGK